MSERSRPIWPSYVLTILLAGLGHWYLGRWKRGGAWLGLFVVALAFLSARTLQDVVEAGEPFVVTALQFDAVNYVDVAVPLAVLVVCLLDVYLIGLTERTDSSPAAGLQSNGS
ncbi:hypothetical protein [Halopiger goleimassiliensis]|uniref:hypothetical protein n=1 Tax=Halopiger goleimassiliensis TaxID=1293048 RepID=UPI0006783181|nr:hypothetical protein [Halopiger goleimassiliensis]